GTPRGSVIRNRLTWMISGQGQDWMFAAENILPVGELPVFCPRGQPVSLPGRIIRVLKRQRIKILRSQGLPPYGCTIACSELVSEELHGYTICDDVMQDHDQDALVLGNADQRHAQK